MKRSPLYTLLWMIGILFPMAFLGKVWPAFGDLFNAAFSAPWTHIAMHAFLYFILGLLLAQWVRPVSKKSLAVLAGCALLVGCIHESIQLLAAGAWPGWPAELLDLAVDLGGALPGIFLARWLFLRKARRGTAARQEQP
jgi:VanZ family protein